MCMEDVRMAREATPLEKVTPLLAAALEVVGRDDKRYGLVISNCGTNDVFLSLSASVTVNNGIQMKPGSDPLVLDLQHHGQMVRGPIYAIASASPGTVAIWSTSLEQE